MKVNPETIPVHFLNIARQFLQDQNVEIEVPNIYDQIPIAMFSDEAAVLPFSMFIESLKLIQRCKSKEEPLALILARLMPLTCTGLFSYAVLAAPNIRLGLKLLNDYFKYVTHLNCKIMEGSDDEVFIEIEGLKIYGEFQQVMNEAVLLKMQEYIALCAGDNASSELWLSASESEKGIVEGSQYSVLLNMGKTQIVLNKLILDRPSPFSEPTIYAANLAKFQSYSNLDGFNLVDRVQELVDEFLAKSGKPNLCLVAMKLGMSERNLSRALQTQESGFQAILDGCVARKARALILDNKSLKSICCDLGFKSSAGLNRAFFRYYGVLPLDVKKNSRLARGFIETR